MSDTTLDEMSPLWDEAVQAFLADPAYVIEMAKAGSALPEHVRSRSESLVSSGV